MGNTTLGIAVTRVCDMGVKLRKAGHDWEFVKEYLSGMSDAMGAATAFGTRPWPSNEEAMDMEDEDDGDDVDEDDEDEEDALDVDDLDDYDGDDGAFNGDGSAWAEDSGDDEDIPELLTDSDVEKE